MGRQWKPDRSARALAITGRSRSAMSSRRHRTRPVLPIGSQSRTPRAYRIAYAASIQIWSRALWDIRGALGHVVADTIILKAQFDFAPDTTMPAAAQATVDTAQALYGMAAANAVRAAFQAR